MIISINADRFYKSYIGRMGPYLVYYRDNDNDENKILVRNISEIAIKYDKIKFLEINWRSLIKLHPNATDENLKLVFLHFNRNVSDVNGLQKSNIINVCNKAIIHYNDKIDTLANNIGSRGRRQAQHITDPSIIVTKQGYKIPYNKHIIYKKRSLLKKKLQTNEDKQCDDIQTIPSANVSKYRKILPKESTETILNTNSKCETDSNICSSNEISKSYIYLHNPPTLNKYNISQPLYKQNFENINDLIQTDILPKIDTKNSNLKEYLKYATRYEKEIKTEKVLYNQKWTFKPNLLVENIIEQNSMNEIKRSSVIKYISKYNIEK